MAKFQSASGATISTIIGEHSSVTGEFEIVGSLKIEGSLKGRLHATERLVVGLGGVVVADAVVRDAIIGGSFTGSLFADARVELEATANVRGDVRTKQLVIHEGAQYEGNISRGEEGTTRNNPEASEK